MKDFKQRRDNLIYEFKKNHSGCCLKNELSRDSFKAGRLVRRLPQ